MQITYKFPTFSHLLLEPDDIKPKTGPTREWSGGVAITEQFSHPPLSITTSNSKVLLKPLLHILKTSKMSILVSREPPISY